MLTVTSDITLVCMNVNVTMRDRQLVRDGSETKTTHRTKRSILKRHVKNILHLIVIYEVLIKPGSTIPGTETPRYWQIRNSLVIGYFAESY